MSGKGKGKGGMTFTRQIPDFLRKMQENSQEDGIAGALKRHREQNGDSDPEDKSDAEDERPQVVDHADALTSKQRRKDDAAADKVARQGGSLSFKNSAGDRFQESAASKVREAEAAAAAAAAASESADAAAADGSHVFAKVKKKKKATSTGAKAVKNEKLLSFAMDDDDEG